MKLKTWVQKVIFLQGIYFIITGMWPLLHIHSFLAVTGDKTDIWLVKMVGLLAATIGIYLIYSVRQQPAKLLGILSAFSFGMIDVYYVYRNTISPIYLVDAFIELILLILLLVLPKK
jgi:hypothetical protein